MEKHQEEMEIASSIIQEFVGLNAEEQTQSQGPQPVIISKLPLLRMIGQLYEECQGRNINWETDFYLLVYKILATKFTIKRMAKKRYREIIKASQVHQSKDLRVRIFAKFLGISSIYDQTTFATFQKLLKFFASKGLEVTKDFTKPKILVPYAYVIESVRNHLNFVGNGHLHNQFKHRLERMRESDGKTSLKNYFDFDRVVEMILLYYNLTKFKGNPYEEVFFAADINGDGSLEFEEFVRITRHYERDFFEKNIMELEKIFIKYSEGSEEDGRLITLSGFKRFCACEKLYSRDSQKRFLREAASLGVVKSCKDLVSNWKIYVKNYVRQKLTECECYTEEFRMLIDKLDRYIFNFDDIYEQKVWLNYKLIEREANRLYEK